MSDITIGQVDDQVKNLPNLAVLLENDLIPAEKKLVILASSLENQGVKGAGALANDVTKKIHDLEVQVNAGAQALSNVTAQLDPYLFLIRNNPIPYSGKVVADVQKGLSVVEKLPEGIQSSITHNQKLVHAVYSALQFVVALLSFAAAYFGAGFSLYGVSLVAVLAGAKSFLQLFSGITHYQDVKK